MWTKMMLPFAIYITFYTPGHLMHAESTDVLKWQHENAISTFTFTNCFTSDAIALVSYMLSKSATRQRILWSGKKKKLTFSKILVQKVASFRAASFFWCSLVIQNLKYWNIQASFLSIYTVRNFFDPFMYFRFKKKGLKRTQKSTYPRIGHNGSFSGSL